MSLTPKYVPFPFDREPTGTITVDDAPMPFWLPPGVPVSDITRPVPAAPATEVPS